MARISKLLSEDGALVFSDLLEAPDVNRDDLKDVYARLNLPNFGDEVTYNKVLTQHGLTKVLSDCTCLRMQQHYGALKYFTSVVKKDELLKNGYTQEQLEQKVFYLNKWIETAEKNMI